MTEAGLRQHYARLNTAEPAASGLSLLQIGALESHLINGESGSEPNCFVLAAGAQVIGRRHFQHMPPSALALEEAIAVVEDQLAPLARQLRPAARLHLLLAADAALQPLFAGREWLSREAVEQQFRLLAEVAEGFPLSASGLPDDASFAASLLILREVMHHLGFAELVRVR
ncbi:hypothetical protein [Uliginosibacterium aquaticum]|uniref:Uncharacterized protein n=1 Tax=Uliginosibacterium aquaticum TaxID=2731212 RepID=A0ABX2IC70_9RHOO|nr:hypothetical protein [Uliginosibacterium aquaticum]NSL53557.1 hypothetical protein [Uliginosibacterium aquaticum]